MLKWNFFWSTLVNYFNDNTCDSNTMVEWKLVSFFIHRRLNRKYTFHDTEIFVNKLGHYGIWSEIMTTKQYYTIEVNKIYLRIFNIALMADNKK